MEESTTAVTTNNAIHSKIIATIKDDKYDLGDLCKMLDPVTSYMNDPFFAENLSKIANILTMDRNGDNEFTLDDLYLLKDDPFAITSLVGGILAILAGTNSDTFKYDSGATEEIMFKLLAYLFLVVIPNETGSTLSLDEKTRLLDIIMAIYNVFLSSQAFNILSTKITKFFQSKGWCKCLCGTPDTNDDDGDVDSKLEDIEHHVKKLHEKNQ